MAQLSAEQQPGPACGPGLLDLDAGVLGTVCSKLDARSLTSLYASCRVMRSIVPGHIHALRFNVMDDFTAHRYGKDGSKADVPHPSKAVHPSFSKRLRSDLHLTLAGKRQPSMRTEPADMFHGPWSATLTDYNYIIQWNSTSQQHDAQLARFFQAAPSSKSLHTCVASLRLEDVGFSMKTAAALETWPSFARIISFELLRCRVSGPVFWVMTSAKNLRHLSIREPQSMADRAVVSLHCALKNLTGLTSLMLEQPRTAAHRDEAQDSPAVFAEVPLPRLPNLQSLSIQNIGICGMPRIQSIAALTSLTHLSLGTSASRSLSAKQLAPLIKGLPQLQSLEVPPVDHAALTEIAASTSLTHLVMNQQRTPAHSFKQSRHLRSLVLKTGDIYRAAPLVASFGVKDSLTKLHLHQDSLSVTRFLGRSLLQPIVERFQGLKDLQLPSASSQGMAVLLSLRGLTRLVLGSAACPPLPPPPPPPAPTAVATDGATGAAVEAGTQTEGLPSTSAAAAAASSAQGQGQPASGQSSTQDLPGPSSQPQQPSQSDQSHASLFPLTSEDGSTMSRSSSFDGSSSVAVSVSVCSEVTLPQPASALPTTLRVLSIGTLNVQWGEYTGLGWLTPCLPWLSSFDLNTLNIRQAELGPEPVCAAEQQRVHEDVSALAAHFAARSRPDASLQLSITPCRIPSALSVSPGRWRAGVVAWDPTAPGMVDGFELHSTGDNAAILTVPRPVRAGSSASGDTGTTEPEPALLEALLPLKPYAASRVPWDGPEQPPPQLVQQQEEAGPSTLRSRTHASLALGVLGKLWPRH